MTIPIMHLSSNNNNALYLLTLPRITASATARSLLPAVETTIIIILPFPNRTRSTPRAHAGLPLSLLSNSTPRLQFPDRVCRLRVAVVAIHPPRLAPLLSLVLSRRTRRIYLHLRSPARPSRSPRAAALRETQLVELPAMVASSLSVSFFVEALLLLIMNTYTCLFFYSSVW